MLRVAWRLLLLGVLGGIVVGVFATLLASLILGALGFVVTGTEGEKILFLFGVMVGVVWFLAVLLTSRRYYRRVVALALRPRE